MVKQAELVEQLSKALEDAQTEQADAEVALIEARVRANEAADEVSRLSAAVAAMTGEKTLRGSSEHPERSVHAREAVGENPTPATKPKKEEVYNPLAHLKCRGCGTKGKMAEQYVTAPSGAIVRMLVCGDCGNQSMMG